jgi:predicted nucleotidyltransferase component of viral defense system
MISRAEVFRVARREGVGDRIIEKDYVLSWILIAIADSDLRDHVAFKGGTALKKVYFPDYRFSEDLDFTLPSNLPHDELLTSLEGLLPSLLRRVNIRLELDSGELSQFNSTTAQFTYVGPLQAIARPRTLKTDFTRGELLVNPPTDAVLSAPYGDYPEGVRLPTYTINEIMAEKLCALMGRTEARDLYDVWWLFESGRTEPVLLAHDFLRKAEHKRQDPARLEPLLGSKEPTFARQWAIRLAEQVRELPHFDEVMRAVKRHVRQLPLD